MNNQENVREFKVSKHYKVSMLFMVTLFLITGFLCFFDKTITGDQIIILLIFSQSCTLISGFIAYNIFRFRITFYKNNLVIKEALKKEKEFKYANISNVKLFSLHGFKIRFNEKYYFISEYINDSHEFLKLLYEKVNKYNPTKIDEKLQRNFEKRYRYLLWRNFYNYWFKKNYLLILLTSILFGIINVFIWNNYFKDVYLDLFFPFILPFYWFLLSYFLYSLKFRKFLKTILIEDSIDGLFNDFYKKNTYKKYFIVFTLMLIVFCMLNYIYL